MYAHGDGREAKRLKRYTEMSAMLVGANCETTLENMEAVVREYAAIVPSFPL